LVKFEEDQTVGDSRITTLPGLQPSARSLKEGADVRDRTAKRLERERKDVKGEKKSKHALFCYFALFTHFFTLVKSK
jgi:inhibitor of growth protein 5/inhibitor of growth protein 4